MTVLDASWIALRLVGVSALVFLLPGLAAVRLASIRVEWPERLLLAFAFSYSWLFVLSIIVVAGNLTVDHAGLLTLAAILAALVWGARNAPVDPTREGQAHRPYRYLAVGAVAVAAGAAGWIIEPPLTGEEALDLVAAARFADGGSMTLTNGSLMPEARSVYLFQPYQMGVGMIARWSGLEPIVALVKLRTVLAPLSLGLLYALLRRFTTSPTQARAALGIVLVFVGFDLHTWEWHGLFPVVRRGGLSAGLCVPTLMGLVVLSTRLTRDAVTQRVRNIAMGLVPAMLLAALCTHALEVFTLLWFVMGLIAATFTGLDRDGDRRQAAILGLILIVTVAGFRTVHTRAVPEVAQFEHAESADARRRVARVATEPSSAFVAVLPEGSEQLLTQRIPSTIVAVAGIPALLLVALTVPALAAVLVFSIAPLIAVYSTSIGYDLVTLATSKATVQFVEAYFALLGAIALAVGLAAAAQMLLAAVERRQNGLATVIATSAVGSLVLGVLWYSESWMTTWLLQHVASSGRNYLWLVLVTGTVTLLTVLRGRFSAAVPGVSWTVVVLSIVLALPIVIAGRSFEGLFPSRSRVSLPTRLAQSASAPSVLDWERYYPQLDGALGPLPVPRTVVDRLRHIMPPRQVLLADPRYSCTLAVLLNAYCINPEQVYGHFFLSARRYHDVYVEDAREGSAWHPLFNSASAPADRERSFLEEYRPDYVLADPDRRDAIGNKLRAFGLQASMTVLDAGYVVYKLGHRNVAAAALTD